MKIFIIIILLIFIIIIYKNKNYEHFTLNDDIITSINSRFKTDYSYLEKMSNQIDELKKTENINIPNNLKNTGVLKINTNIPSSEKQIKINNEINITNRDNNTKLINIYPKYFIMIWATNNFIPKGWVLCDGSSYIIDGNNYTKLESNMTRPTDKIIINVPDFRGVAVRGINNISQPHLFNQLVGEDKIHLNTNKLPRHEHWLPTALDESKPSEEGVGFQYENLFINSNKLLRLDGNTYVCEASGLFDIIKCGAMISSTCNKICEFESTNDANQAQLDTLKKYYTLWNTSYTTLSRVKSDKQTYDNIQFASKTSITKRNIQRLPPLEGYNNLFKTVTNLNIYYASSYDAKKKNDLIVTTGEEFNYNANETKLIDAPPPYCVLNYIIKLT